MRFCGLFHTFRDYKEQMESFHAGLFGDVLHGLNLHQSLHHHKCDALERVFGGSVQGLSLSQDIIKIDY